MEKLIEKWAPMIGKKLAIASVILLVSVKLVLPFTGYHLASIIEPLGLNSNKIIEETNYARQNLNLAPLKQNNSLSLAALEKAQDMANNGYFAHVSPSGVTPWFWMSKNGYKFAHAGENLALGFVNEKDAVRAWLESPSHRDNILNNHYEEIGVAAIRANLDGINGILVVQMFGKPSVAPVLQEPLVPTPTLSPTPAVVRITETPKTQVSGEFAEEPLKEPVVLQPISTDENIQPVAGPIEKFTDNFKEVRTTANVLNYLFIGYALVILLISAFSFILVERSKKTFFMTMFYFGIVLLAIILPVMQVSASGWIY